MVVWKSPRNRQHARGTFSEASSPSSSPAELQVREIASKIGLFDDSEILATVCHKMRKEYVVEEWQLPALDSRQWEKMHAPIGLAVAVQHVSGHRLREQEIIELRSRKEYTNNIQAYNKNLQNESLHEDKKEEDSFVSSSFQEDMTKTTPSSAGSSKQEEKEKTEIVAKTASDDDLEIVQVLALATSNAFSAITIDEDINDEPNKTEKVVTVNENEQDDEGNHPPPASDDFNESGEFSDDSSDWLKLSKVATAKDNEGALEQEEECNRGAEAASPEIDHTDIDEDNGGIDSTMAPISSVKMAEVALKQANFEPVNGIEQKNPNSVENKMGATQVETELENSIASPFVETKQEEAQVGIEPMNKSEREIFTTIEKIIETVQVITEPVSGMEQESSTAPAKIEREQEASQENSMEQEVSQVEIKPVERDSDSDSDSATIPNHVEQMEIPLVKNDNGDGRDSATTSMHVPKKVQEDFDIAKTEDIRETSSTSSEAESDVNTDIFSGILKNVSFSDDEDDPMLTDIETTKLDCLLDPIENTTDDTAISSMSKLETHRLLYPENYADDITVAISNVSPEILLLAAKRKKKMKKYRQKLDKGKYCRLLQYVHQRHNFELYPRLEMQQDVAMYLTVFSSVLLFLAVNLDKESFEIETAVLQDILVHLPDDDHRTILSQLMIMTNARDKEKRTSIAFQVQDHLLALIEKNEMDVDCEKAVQFIFHLSRLKKSYRLVFGKSLFRAMSKIYKRTEKLKEKNNPKRNKKEEKNVIVDDIKNLAQDEQETQQEGKIEDDNRVESGSLHI